MRPLSHVGVDVRGVFLRLLKRARLLASRSCFRLCLPNHRLNLLLPLQLMRRSRVLNDRSAVRPIALADARQSRQRDSRSFYLPPVNRSLRMRRVFLQVPRVLARGPLAMCPMARRVSLVLQAFPEFTGAGAMTRVAVHSGALIKARSERRRLRASPARAVMIAQFVTGRFRVLPAVPVPPTRGV